MSQNVTTIIIGLDAVGPGQRDVSGRHEIAGQATERGAVAPRAEAEDSVPCVGAATENSTVA